MSELLDGMRYLTKTVDEDTSVSRLYLRSIFPGKTTSFVGDPLSSTEAADPSSNLLGKGTIFALMPNEATFTKLSDKHNDIAARPRRKSDKSEIRNLMDIQKTALRVAGGDEISFVVRPQGTELVEAKWIHYNMRTAVSGTCNDSLPAGKWNVTYVICCGSYGEDLISGAPNKFILYSREV